MVPNPHAGWPPAERHFCEMRDLLLAGLCLDRIRLDPPPTQSLAVRRDVRRACEHIADTDAPVPFEVYDARPIWDAAGANILACVERGDTAGLRPTEWALRTIFRDWFEANWFKKLWSVANGCRPPTKVGRLRRRAAR